MSRLNTSHKVQLSNSTTHLCFDKDEFMKDTFDVDGFVAECRHRVQLETLREDLHIFFTSLKNAMVELINKDYADFVNLSSNLVGLDKAIGNLAVPLGQFKEEVLTVEQAMDSAVAVVEQKMAARARIWERKAVLQRLINITKSVEKMENILKIAGSTVDTTEEDESIELSGQQIERVASEFNQLQYYVTQSKGLPLVEKIRPRIAGITVTLQHSLEKSFEEGLQNGQRNVLRQCLRTYATIDKMRDVEALFRKIAVKLYMNEVISEKALQNHPHKLKGLYASVLDFIPKHCKLIQEVTSPVQRSAGEDVVRGYDFLVNAVWPEVATSLEMRTASIFAAGNPTSFHEKYLATTEFVERFELLCGSQASVKRLHIHPSFNSFMAKWSLPVYFQLRFQEIAGSFETALLAPFSVTTEEASSPLTLNAFQALWQCLHRSWHQDVYLAPLCHRFWKLTLQLLSRCSVWVDEVCSTEIAATEKEESQQVKNPETAKAPKAQQPSSDSISQRDSTKGIVSSTTESTVTTADVAAVSSPPITVFQVVSLVADVDHLCDKLPGLFNSLIAPKMAAMNCKFIGTLSDVFDESVKNLSQRQAAFGDYITQNVSSQCTVHLKSANDIPRLYRRTNRELPSKPSTYVGNTLKPLQLFVQEYGFRLDDKRRQQWLVNILLRICQAYLSISTELLSSVKKTEDSLKRLKALRKTDAAAAAAQQGTSDDDKIRLQLALDVRYFGEQVESVGVCGAELKPYRELQELVSSAVSHINL